MLLDAYDVGSCRLGQNREIFILEIIVPMHLNYVQFAFVTELCAFERELACAELATVLWEEPILPIPSSWRFRFLDNQCSFFQFLRRDTLTATGGDVLQELMEGLSLPGSPQPPTDAAVVPLPSVSPRSAPLPRSPSPSNG
jgi:hypothetical protein